MTNIDPVKADFIAIENGLYRPFPTSDRVHYQLLNTTTYAQLEIQTHSPVALLLIDPSGRRIGFDPSTSTEVNDFGFGAWYTGEESEPQIIHLETGSVI